MSSDLDFLKTLPGAARTDEEPAEEEQEQPAETTQVTQTTQTVTPLPDVTTPPPRRGRSGRARSSIKPVEAPPEGREATVAPEEQEAQPTPEPGSEPVAEPPSEPTPVAPGEALWDSFMLRLDTSTRNSIWESGFVSLASLTACTENDLLAPRGLFTPAQVQDIVHNLRLVGVGLRRGGTVKAATRENASLRQRRERRIDRHRTLAKGY